MSSQSSIRLLAQILTAGLVAAAFVLLILPHFEPPPRVVEIRQGQAPPFPGPGNGQVGLAGGPVSYAEAVALASPAVVNINTAKLVTRRVNPLFDDPVLRELFGDRSGSPRRRLETSLGSGVIVSPQGFVLTNHHVVEGADEIQLMLEDGRTAAAVLVGSDPETDLAVLRMDLRDVPAIVFGRSDDLRVGDVVLAIGNPFGVGKTVTQGIVSATGRAQLGISTFENFIQTDAAINPGNSGGALVNAFGQLVGINTAIFSKTGGSQGIGFAIPESLARGVMTDIIERGRVARGWLGIEIQELTRELAESFGLEQARGVLIAGVLRDSPAARAGLRPGDVLLQVNGAQVPDPRAALNAITRAAPGERLQLEVLREGRIQAAQAIVTERPPPRARR